MKKKVKYNPAFPIKEIERLIKVRCLFKKDLLTTKKESLIKFILAFMTIKTIVTAESQKLGTLLKLKKNIILI